MNQKQARIQALKNVIGMIHTELDSPTGISIEDSDGHPLPKEDYQQVREEMKKIADLLIRKAHRSKQTESRN